LLQKKTRLCRIRNYIIRIHGLETELDSVQKEIGGI
jgi:hypothetical protein